MRTKKNEEKCCRKLKTKAEKTPWRATRWNWIYMHSAPKFHKWQSPMAHSSNGCDSSSRRPSRFGSTAHIQPTSASHNVHYTHVNRNKCSSIRFMRVENVCLPACVCVCMPCACPNPCTNGKVQKKNDYLWLNAYNALAATRWKEKDNYIYHEFL